MSLSSGARIGAFEIIDKLGEGGMGEVYRARDTKLDRVVALKVLPELFTVDAERVARFEREAKVLAQLNHPNIAQVYGFEPPSLGPAAIAMELVEGPTLEDLIREHRADTGAGLPFDRALAIARQIAVALEVAHDQGIIHRDLKPANIKVRDDGTVKVLDFGLAKAFASDAEAQQSAVSNSPTLTARSTQLGMIIGTAAYMSPEQAKARPVDRRADVWAFGVVFFEMLAGRRAFEGDDVSDVLASVLKTDPDWSVLPADLPAPARRLLRRCLEKDPKKRLRDISEGILQLDEGLASGSLTSTITPAVPAAPADRWRAWLQRWGAIGITAVATALIVGAIGRWKTPEPAPLVVARSLHIPPAAAPLLVSVAYPDIAISSDGRMIAYSVGVSGGGSAIYLRPIDQLDAAPIRGAQTAIAPFFSPDAQWVGFIEQIDQTQIKKVSVLGGPPVAITKHREQITGTTWMDDGIVFGSRNGPLHFVANAGGEAVPLTTLDSGETLHGWPSAVPGTSVVLFSAGSVNARGLDGRLGAVDRRTGRTVRLNVAGLRPQYISSGHIIFATEDGSLRAVGFDPSRLEVIGTPVPVLEGVGVKGSGAANFAISANGHLVHSAGGSVEMARTLVWVDRSGRETPIAAPARNYFYARISPDGTRLSLDSRDAEQDLWVWDVKRETLTRLTDKPGPDQYGLWTRDNRIVFNSTATVSTRSELFHHRPDGVGEPVQITDSKDLNLIPFPNAITPDGKHVIFRAATVGNAKNDLYLAELSGTKKITKLLGTEHDERNAALSPRGDYMLFESDMSGGRNEVYVRPFPDVDRIQIKVSTDGGQEPVWSPTGREIFYLAGGKLISVPVRITAGGLDLGKPAALFDAAAYFFGGAGRNYDVTADGNRFVMVKNPPDQRAATQPITIVLNWIEELRSRIR